MKAQVKTAGFAFTLVAVVLWSISISVYGLASGAAERILVNRAASEKCAGGVWVPRAYPGAPPPREQCEAAVRMMYPRRELVVLGNPLFLLAQYVLLPSLVALTAAAYGSSALAALKSMPVPPATTAKPR
jgi:hypothetical protein